VILDYRELLVILVLRVQEVIEVMLDYRGLLVREVILDYRELLVILGCRDL
jgi:hypothetical protein